MEKYVVYYRVSTKKQGESGLGLEAQKAYVHHFIDSDQIVKTFTEVASAKYMDCNNRPQLCEALDYCIQNNCFLVVAKIDRLSRKTEHALSIYDKLDGRLISCDIPNLEKFTLTLFMAIADRERELISIRTKQALAERKKKGTALGTPSNLTRAARMKGAARMKAKAANNVNTKKARNYAKILRNQGSTLQAIADILNNEGHLTARGKSYSRTSIKRLLEA
ncbi:MAG: recombinase family protein [Saprospiraceae bacterium]|nr:recombinase family protein [Saprospiraceae bacterium]